MSSFSGKLKEFPHISVDRFDGRNLASTAYFLSHAHSDHMVGLSSPQFLDHLESNSGVYLYCSVITARFLHASIRHRPLSPFLRPLPPDEPVKITIPTVANEPHHALTVTLIPAGHCPGSVMLLLEGRGGTVLYTGDFRLGVGESNQLRALHNPDGSVKTLHSLHIDTTFCHRRVLSFPSRHESAEAVGDLVEEWLARGNNHLIHLHCPAKYGYEFLYRSLHERFNMRVHVSRWKYRMYDTVPEIQDSLTTDATETWIHACDWRQNDEGSSLSSGGPTVGGGAPRKRMLPCRCVPYGVDTEPNIRVIKPSALFYTTYQTHKEICQVSEEGTFCRVLLSMHASCSEVLDMVAYLRPRKVYPNVIPANSSKEEVLSLLHEALSQSGDHYSIEYDGRGSGGGGAGHYRRLTPPLSISTMSTPDQDGDTDTPLGTFKRQLPPPSNGSPSKRRRHSDSGSIMQDVLLLTLPNPRGNMKGSLSLEGEPQQALTEATNDSETAATNSTGTAADLRQVGLLHSSPSMSSSQSSPMSAPVSPLLPPKISPAELLLCSAADDLSSDSALGHTLSAMHKSGEWGSRCGGGSSSQDSECSSVFSDDPDQTILSKSLTDTDYSVTAREQNGEGDGAPVRRTFTRDLSVSSVMSEGGESVCSLLDDKAGRRRRMWYKHHHFSTPVTEDLSNFTQPNRLTLRSSSLPDTHTLPLTHPPHLVSSHSLHPPPIPSLSPPLPLITVSSPSASESQLSSDDTSATVIMGSEFSDQSTRPRDFETVFREKRPSTAASCPVNGWHRTDAACKEPRPAHDVIMATATGGDAVRGSMEDDDSVFEEVRDYTRKTLSNVAGVVSVANNSDSINNDRDDDSGISSLRTTFSDDRWCNTSKSDAEKSEKCIPTSRPTVIRTAVAATLSTSCSQSSGVNTSYNDDNGNPVLHSPQAPSSTCPVKASQSEVTSTQSLKELQCRVGGSVSPSREPQLLSSEGVGVAAPRSSCLKTARRTAADRLEVVSLDQQQL